MSYQPGYRFIAKTPKGEHIVSMTVLGDKLFVATSTGMYRLAQRRKGQFKLIPILFEAKP